MSHTDIPMYIIHSNLYILITDSFINLQFKQTKVTFDLRIMRHLPPNVASTSQIN